VWISGQVRQQARGGDERNRFTGSPLMSEHRLLSGAA
jgi:hypothetical protein